MNHSFRETNDLLTSKGYSLIKNEKKENKSKVSYKGTNTLWMFEYNLYYSSIIGLSFNIVDDNKLYDSILKSCINNNMFSFNDENNFMCYADLNYVYKFSIQPISNNIYYMIAVFKVNKE
ncbi:MAG: hypothetical protein ACEQR5_01475 [Moraxellaceae bacterium]|jgi:hypothetical protein